VRSRDEGGWSEFSTPSHRAEHFLGISDDLIYVGEYRPSMPALGYQNPTPTHARRRRNDPSFITPLSGRQKGGRNERFKSISYAYE